MLNRYGSLISDIFQMIDKDSSLATEILPGAGYIKAEVLYAVTHEGARSLVDVMARRLRISMEHSSHGLGVSREIAEMIAPILSWGATDIHREVLAYEGFITTEMAAVR